MSKLQSILAQHGVSRVFKKGTMLLYQGEIPRHAFVVSSGLVRAYVITTTGEERVIALHPAGDIIPLSWVFGKTPTALFYYDTVVDSTITTLSKTTLLATTKDPQAMQEVLALTVNEYTALLLRIAALEQATAAEKIALTLHFLLLRHGVQLNTNTYAIDIKMTQSMVASLVGITRESAAVNLKLLKEKGVVEYSNFRYTVHKQALERFVGEDSFKDLLR